jgi:FkbM family methyltransferase
MELIEEFNLGRHRVKIDLQAGASSHFWKRADAGWWEPGTLRLIEALAVPGAQFIDIGAWIGPTCLSALKSGFEVIAFEPDPVAFAQLSKNCILNTEPGDILGLHQLALSRRPGRRRLSPATELGDSQSSLVQTGNVIDGHDVTVMSGSEVLASPAVRDGSLVKIDIEGGEYALVPSIRSVLQRRQMVVMLSTHPTRVSPLFGTRANPHLKTLFAVIFGLSGSLGFLPLVASHSWWEDAPHTTKIKRLGFPRLLKRLFGGHDKAFYLFPRPTTPPRELVL